jgi:hypothetical protein
MHFAEKDKIIRTSEPFALNAVCTLGCAQQVKTYVGRILPYG